MKLSLENKIKKLASKFKTQPKPEFLKAVHDALVDVDERAVSDSFNRIWKNHKTFPSLAEITRLVNSELVKYQKKQVALENHRHCSECDNQGWFMVINPGRGYTTIASCSCPKGVDIRTTKGYLRFDDCAANGYTRRYREWKNEQRKT